MSRREWGRENNIPDEFSHRATGAEWALVGLRGLDGILYAHLGIEPRHILCRDSCVHALARRHDVEFASPDSELRSDTAQRENNRVSAESMQNHKNTPGRIGVRKVAGALWHDWESVGGQRES